MATISEISPYGPDCFFENVEEMSSFIDSSQTVWIEKVRQVHDRALVFSVSLIKKISYNFFVASMAVTTLFPTIPAIYIGAAIVAQSVVTYFFYKNRFENKESSFFAQINKKVALICDLKGGEKTIWAVNEVFQALAVDIGANFALNILPIYPRHLVCLFIFVADGIKLIALSHSIFSKVEGKLSDFNEFLIN